MASRDHSRCGGGGVQEMQNHILPTEILLLHSYFVINKILPTSSLKVWGGCTPPHPRTLRHCIFGINRNRKFHLFISLDKANSVLNARGIKKHLIIDGEFRRGKRL